MDNNFLKAETRIDLPAVYTMTKRRIRYDHIALCQGILNCGYQPKYKQHGSTFLWHPGYIYFAVKIEKANGLEQLEDTTMLEVFATVDWGGQVQRTRCMSDASIPVFDETFYFLIPLGDAELANEQKLIEALKGEFQTKSRVVISLWRKFYGGILVHLGSAAFNIGDIQEAKAEDITFITEDKKAIIYETRVLAKNLLLSSSFNADLNAQVSMKAWFFYDLPSSFELTPYVRNSDDLPKFVEDGMKNLSFEKKWRAIVAEIYEHSDVPRELRKYDTHMMDHCKRDHFMPLFLASMSPPDSGSISDISNPYDQKIRTMQEAAHFARCFPYDWTPRTFWVSPDGTIAMQKGSIFDHTLLMASLFLGCGFETFDKLIKKIEKLKKAKEGKKKKKPVSKKHNISFFDKELEYVEKGYALEIEQDSLINPNEGKGGKAKTVVSAKSEKGEGEGEGEDEDADEGMTEVDAQLQEELEELPDEVPLQNRVFVCMGSDKVKKAQYAWVMVFDPECANVTLYDPLCHTEYYLPRRVKKKDFLKEFLKFKPNKDGIIYRK